MSVLVLGLGPGGIGIVRSLSFIDKLQIVGVCFDRKKERGYFTRLCQVVEWPDPQKNEMIFLENMHKFGNKKDIIILFFTRDEEVLFFANKSHLIESRFLYYRNSIEQVKNLEDKMLSAKIAQRCGIRIPVSIIICDENKENLKNIKFPVILKPISVPPADFPDKNIIFNNNYELIDFLRNSERFLNKCILQEYIPGEDEQIYQCNALIPQNAKILQHIEFRKLRQYPVGRGIACFGHTTSENELQRLVYSLSRETGVKGLISAEFKKDYRNAQWVFIEANLRLPVYNSVFPYSDCNLAKYYIEDLLNIKLDINRKISIKKQAFWMHEELDLSNVLKKKVNIKFFTWIKQFIQSDACAYFQKNDILPFLIMFFSFTKKCIFNFVTLFKRNQ